LNFYTSISGCGCGFGFEQKFWLIDGFGEKKARIGGFAYPYSPPSKKKAGHLRGRGVRTPCTLPLDPPLLVNLSKSEAIVLVILLTRLRIDLSSGVNPLEQLYVLIAFVDLWFQSRQIAQSLSGQILLGIDKSLNRGTENFVQSTLFIRGSIAWSLFAPTINEHTIIFVLSAYNNLYL